MARQLRVLWDDSFTKYDFGAAHPMDPLRLDLTARLCRALGLFDDGSRVEVVGAEPADDALLATVHDLDYVAAVKAASLDPSAADLSRGLGTDDDPAFVGMHEASARVVQGSVDLATAVWNGEVEHAVNFCGGLHHAMRDRASGFCVYNDAAAAIQRLLDLGAQKVAYVDVDVHHGDGVERIFWDDPRVLTISVHESGRVLFPGTGFAEELGGPQAQGSAVNVALPPGTSDAGWLRGGRSPHERSHGQSFLDLAYHRFGPNGLYVLDEPEAALSVQGCLALMVRIRELLAQGCQFVVATHSPILLALPGARILQIDSGGTIEQVDYEQAEPVALTRAFVNHPHRFLDRMFAEEPRGGHGRMSL